MLDLTHTLYTTHIYASRRRDTVKLTVCVSVCLCVCVHVFQM